MDSGTKQEPAASFQVLSAGRPPPDGRGMITVPPQVIRDMGIEPTEDPTWRVGDRMRILYEAENGRLPPKELRPKTNDKGSHCFAVPPGRMKGGREHRVPLSDQAAAIIREMEPDAEDVGQKYDFPGAKPGRPLSNTMMSEVIQCMNAEREVVGKPKWTDPKQNNRDIVPHGFRSSFKDWATDWTPSQAEIVEAAKRRDRRGFSTRPCRSGLGAQARQQKQKRPTAAPL